MRAVTIASPVSTVAPVSDRAYADFLQTYWRLKTGGADMRFANDRNQYELGRGAMYREGFTHLDLPGVAVDVEKRSWEQMPSAHFVAVTAEGCFVFTVQNGDSWAYLGDSQHPPRKMSDEEERAFRIALEAQQGVSRDLSREDAVARLRESEFDPFDRSGMIGGPV
jgi:hypothetical protein